jgi:outer membrane lipoprotein-sorting protein
MKAAVHLFLALALVAPVAAEQAPAESDRSAEALEIVEKADAAIKKIGSVRLEARATPSGSAERFLSASEGTAVLVGWNGSTAERFYSHVTTKRQGTGETLELTGGGDGDNYFIIDHGAKQAYEDMDPAVLGSGRNALGVVGMIEFVHDSPFDDELNADKLELLGEEKVGDEECYKVRVVYAGGQGESTWFFSKSDFLPRRRVRKFDIPQQGEGALEITITKLEVDPKVDPGIFKLQLPEGYEQIDDFYP